MEVEKELLAYYSPARVAEVFSSFQDVIQKVEYSKEQVSEALSFWVKSNKQFPFSDILHSVIARDNNAVLVSRDRHFLEIDLAESVMPEDVN